MARGLIVRKRTSELSKNLIKHRQMISTKFPKSFRCARDLMVPVNDKFIKTPSGDLKQVSEEF